MVASEVAYGSYTIHTDVYWFATTAVSSSDALCVRWADQNSTPKKCNQVRVRHPWKKVFDGTSDNTWKQGICHEVGHSVGFDDSSPETSAGCMSGGSNGTLSTHEINHINNQY